MSLASLVLYAVVGLVLFAAVVSSGVLFAVVVLGRPVAVRNENPGPDRAGPGE